MGELLAELLYPLLKNLGAILFEALIEGTPDLIQSFFDNVKRKDL